MPHDSDRPVPRRSTASNVDSRAVPDTAARLGRWMSIALWVLLLGFGTWYADGWLEQRNAADAPRSLIDASGQQAIELLADRQGHYLVAGNINGQSVNFLLDTGASQVSIPAALATELDLQAGRRVPVNTANGRVVVRQTQLDEVRLGPLVRHSVPANIVPGMDGQVALLGMSFLREFDWTQSKGRLTISEAQ